MRYKKATHSADVPASTALPTPQGSAAARTLAVTQDTVMNVPQSTGLAAWEIAAQRMIEKKRLSLDKELGRSTWKQKYSNDVRLKLLKNDGFDITTLRARNASADEIIDALLARVNARKQRRPAAAAVSVTRAATATAKLLLTSNTALSSHKDPLLVDNAGTTYVQSPIVLTSLAGSKRKHMHESSDYSGRFEDDSVVKDRKNHDITTLSSVCVSLCTCGPLPKRKCLQSSVETHMSMMKIARVSRLKHTRSKFFQASRVARIMSSPSSFEVRAAVIPSVVIFSSPTLLLDPDIRSDLRISSRGLAFIADDLKLLSTGSGSNGDFYIEDPNPDEDAEQNRRRDTPESDQWRYRIGVSEGPDKQFILKGDTRALISVLTHFKDSELIHPTQWVWNGEMLVPEYGAAFTLSTDSQATLGRIIEKLDTKRHIGGMDIRVQQCPDGKTLRYN